LLPWGLVLSLLGSGSAGSGSRVDMSRPARPRDAWSSNGHAPEYFYDEHGEFRQLRGDQDAAAPGTVTCGTVTCGTVTSGTVRTGRHVRIAVAVTRSYTLWPDTHGLAGVDEADGTIMWRIRKPDAGTGFRSGPPAYLGGTDRHLVLVGAVGHNQAAPIVSGWCRCPRGGRAPDPGEPNTCLSCGGIFQPWAMVAVHDRLSGRRLWGQRWPDREPPHTVLGEIADIRGGVVLSREGDFLRARRIEDGQLLWSAVPAREYQRFVWPGRFPASQWAWLARLANSEDRHRPPVTGDLFVQAVTGRTITIDWALCQTGDDLVLTYADGILTCLALPGSPVLRQRASIAAGPR
jgi:hypothetical protein